jgi:hypothetical protein
MAAGNKLPASESERGGTRKGAAPFIRIRPLTRRSAHFSHGGGRGKGFFQWFQDICICMNLAAISANSQKRFN